MTLPSLLENGGNSCLLSFEVEIRERQGQDFKKQRKLHNKVHKKSEKEADAEITAVVTETER